MGLLSGKNALVCGITNKKSIAWGIAQTLYSEGARIALGCVEANLRRATKLAPEVGAEMVITCDVRDDSQISKAFNQVGRGFDGKLDILVHSIAFAALEDLEGEFIGISRDGWNLALESSAYSLVALSRAARPFLVKAGGGSIITLTFLGGRLVVPGYNIMGIAKAALDMTVRYLAYDLGPDNIRVNAISAGPISTTSSLAIQNFESSLRLVQQCAPLQRNISLGDVGRTAVYLASDLSAALTGNTLSVDSGMNILAAPGMPHPRHTGTL